jgi:hypothetical protein
MRLAETHRLCKDGKEVAIVQAHREGGYFWYGGGVNTAGLHLELDEAKKQAKAHMVEMFASA